jgi:signal transduction histidine kinase
MSALQSNITDVDARVEFDFSESPEINYIPAYLESIFQNLLTNSIKYRQQNHAPLIKCYTFQMNGHIYMIFEDNGVGIDLERHGDKVFGMYKTFHKNADAKGIGLFITRSQVESLGGTIKIESTVNVGTKFTLKLT